MRFFSYLLFYNNFYELQEEDRPSDVIISDDVEIEKWWKAYTSGNTYKAKTSTRNRRKGNKESHTYKF